MKKINDFFNLSKKLNLEIDSIIKFEKLVKQYKSNVFLIGGNVRDLLLCKKISSNPDLVTDMKICDLVKILKKKKIKYSKVGIKYGSIVIFLGKNVIEVTSMRKDIETDGRWVKIKYTKSLYEDAQRRDFTVNSIYSDTSGNLFDPFNGYKDLKSKNIKFIGDPNQRIKEDYLRILRFIRFTYLYTKNFNSEGFKNCIKNKNKIKKLSFERRLEEVKKIIILEKIEKTNEIKKIKPFLEVALQINIDEKNFDQFCRVERKLKNICALRRLKYLFRKKKYENIDFEKMKFSNIEKSRFLKKVKFIKYDLGELIRMIFEIPKENIIDQLIFEFTEKKISPHKFNKFINYLDNFKKKKFPLTGNDLKKLGIKDGIELGKILKKTTLWWYNQECKTTKRDCLNYVKKITKRQREAMT